MAEFRAAAIETEDCAVQFSNYAKLVSEVACIVSLGGMIASVAIYILRLGAGDSVAAVVFLTVQGILPVWVGMALLLSKFSSVQHCNVSVAAASIAALLVPSIAVFSRFVAILLMLALALWAAILLWRKKRVFFHCGYTGNFRCFCSRRSFGCFDKSPALFYSGANGSRNGDI